MANVFFVDIVDMFGVLLSVFFYLTPVFYPLSIVPDGILKVVEYNPITILLSLFRYPIYLGQIPPSDLFLTASLIAIGVFLLGWLVFTRKVDEFAYRI